MKVGQLGLLYTSIYFYLSRRKPESTAEAKGHGKELDTYMGAVQLEDRAVVGGDLGSNLKECTDFDVCVLCWSLHS